MSHQRFQRRRLAGGEADSRRYEKNLEIVLLQCDDLHLFSLDQLNNKLRLKTDRKMKYRRRLPAARAAAGRRYFPRRTRDVRSVLSVEVFMDGGGAPRAERGGGLSPPRSWVEFDWLLIAATRWRGWWPVPFGGYTCDLVALRGGHLGADTWCCAGSFGGSAKAMLSFSRHIS
nr:hypothetical protein Itr_chr03CG24740 [Ipomoea trifida]